MGGFQPPKPRANDTKNTIAEPLSSSERPAHPLLQNKDAAGQWKLRRLSRAMSSITRKIRGGIRCLNENGWRYTLKHAFQKVSAQIHYKVAWLRAVKSGLNKTPRHPRLIVCVTSSPARIRYTDRTIQSLLRQSVRADRCILWLAKEAFPGGELSLPTRLTVLGQYGLEIRWHSANSADQVLISALSEFPNDIILTASDAYLYHADMIATLFATYQKNPDLIHCLRASKLRYLAEKADLQQVGDHNGYQIPSYLNMPLIGTGCLFPPAALSVLELDQACFASFAAEADDMRSWLLAAINDVKVNVIDPPYDHAHDFYILQNKTDTAHTDEQSQSMHVFDLSGVFAAYPEIQARIQNEQSEMALFEVALSIPQEQKDYNYFKNLDSSLYRAEITLWYQAIMQKRLDLDHPKTYNEKLQWMKLYDSTPLKAMLTDKYSVRDWIAARIGSQYLVKLLGVWDAVDDIDLSNLPDRFVLKATHGSNWVIVVKDKTKIDWKTAKKKMRQWLNTNFAFVTGLELHYKHIPARIIAEEYLENTDADLYDYKFWCFEGKVHSILFLSERNTGGLKMSFFNPQWERMDLSYDYPRHEKQIQRPAQLEQMIALSERIAKGFPHARVDLYLLNNGEIKFGEITFTSASGACNWNPPEADIMLGEQFTLPEASPLP